MYDKFDLTICWANLKYKFAHTTSLFSNNIRENYTIIHINYRKELCSDDIVL